MKFYSQIVIKLLQREYNVCTVNVDRVFFFNFILTFELFRSERKLK